MTSILLPSVGALNRGYLPVSAPSSVSPLVGVRVAAAGLVYPWAYFCQQSGTPKLLNTIQQHKLGFKFLAVTPGPFLLPGQLGTDTRLTLIGPGFRHPTSSKFLSCNAIYCLCFTVRNMRLNMNTGSRHLCKGI